ncbi:L-asparaginase [Opitutaceae bacterium EW11]|nr:L-asparaginase [Opitutaceae bacterium EW11]
MHFPPRLCLALVSLLAPAVCPTAPAQEIPSAYAPKGVQLPRVVILSMGGTIASRGDTRLNVSNYGGKGFRVAPDDWVHDLPDLALYAQVRTEDFRQPEDVTGGMTIEHWYKVARRLQELAEDKSVDGIVVTHGTNTMAETAYFMDLVVSIHKPVVFVGSQRPWTGLSGDGPLNLLNAVRVAACPDAADKGVLHAMNQFVNPARDVTKTSAYRVETFKSVDLGAIGVADPDIVKFYSSPVRRHTFNSEFNIASLPAQLPPVEIVYAYTEPAGYLIDALVDHGVKGIVVDGTGAGALGGTQVEAVKRAQAKGVVVVATARTRGGRVQDTIRRREANIVAGDNLPPEKARTLLQLALTKTTDLEEIRRIFNEY